MIIFLYGPNTYSRYNKFKEIVAEYEKRLGNILLERFDFASESKDEFEKFQAFVGSRSMFDPKKFAVVDSIFESKDKKELKKILENILEDRDTIVIAVSDVKAPTSFSFLNNKPVVSQEFKDIKKGAELTAFIKKESTARGMNLTVDEMNNLADVWGGDLWAIATELDRLVLTSERVLPRSINEDFFKLVNTAKSGYNLKSRIVALEVLLSERGDDPAKVFNMMCYGFNSPELINALADYDVMIKSGKLDYDEVLLDLVLR